MLPTAMQKYQFHYLTVKAIFYLDKVSDDIHVKISISFPQVCCHFLNFIICNAIILYFDIVGRSTICVLNLGSQNLIQKRLINFLQGFLEVVTKTLL